MIKLSDEQSAQLVEQVRKAAEAMTSAAAAIRAELERRGYSPTRPKASERDRRVGEPDKT